MEVTNEKVTEYAVRLAKKLVETENNTGRTVCHIEASRLIRIHPDLRSWPVWAKDRLKDEAVEIALKTV